MPWKERYVGEKSALDLFADELRRARARAGVTQEALSQQINFSASLIAKIELSQRRPTRDFARRCDQALDTGGLLERIRESIGSGPVLPWFEQWATNERIATSLRSFEPAVIPGLLQTKEYARALFSGGGLLTVEEVEEQITARLERQEVLNRADPPYFNAVIDERVLHQPVGGPEVMREQLRHIVKVCETHPRVRIQVVPTRVGSYAGLNGPFVIATLPEEGDVAFLDDPLGGRFVDRTEDIAALLRTWESIRGDALSHQQSTELIREVAEQWS